MSDARVGETSVPGARRGEQVSERPTKVIDNIRPQVTPLPRSWSQFIPGDPAPKGSIVQAIDPRTNRKFTRESSRRAKPWMEAITEVAVLTRPKGGPLEAPVGVRITLYVRRPKTVTRPFPTGRGDGDTDKHVRACLDALIGPVLVDDSDVVLVRATKLWAPSERDTGAHISAWEIPEDQWGALGG